MPGRSRRAEEGDWFKRGQEHSGSRRRKEAETVVEGCLRLLHLGGFETS